MLISQSSPCHSTLSRPLLPTLIFVQHLHSGGKPCFKPRKPFELGSAFAETEGKFTLQLKTDAKPEANAHPCEEASLAEE